jgi:hypothetical protein
VFFFLNLCFPACVKQALSAEPIWNLISVNSNQLWTLHKKPNGPSKGLGQASQPASQPGRCEMSSLFIHHYQTHVMSVTTSLSLSVHTSIHPGKTIIARCGCANIYELE